MIGAITVLWHAILGIGWLVRRHDNAVAQCQMFKLIGLKKRVVGHVRGSGFGLSVHDDIQKCTVMSILSSLMYISDTFMYTLLVAIRAFC